MTNREKLVICLRAMRDALQTGGTDGIHQVLERGFELLGVNPHKNGEIDDFIASVDDETAREQSENQSSFTPE